MLNKVLIQGRITKPIELKSTANGKTCCNFSIASQRTKEDKDFVKCVAWNKTAEIISKYFNKGSMIIIEGNLKYRIYEGPGGKREVLEVLVDKVFFAESAKSSTAQNDFDNPAAPSSSTGYEEISEDDDLPF